MQKGSKSKGMNLADVAKLHGMTAQELMPQLRKGIKHEYEHTTSKQVARRTALDHLVEFPDYYDRLDKIEKMHLGGDMSKHLAPNGKPSKLNHEQWHLVRTPEFKAWFGDWENDPKNASKVVDENGEPLVLWHYAKTLKYELDKFYIFNVDKQLGSHFGSLRQSQKIKYPNQIIINEEPIDFKYYQVFLNIRNPIRLKDVGIFESDTLIDAIGSENIEDDDWNYLYDFNGKSENTYVDRLKFISKSKFGYDGAVYLNRYESDAKTSFIISLDEVSDKIFKIKVPSAEDSWIAFEPNQIKLADGSNTTFDGDNPDIRFDKGGEIENLIDQGEIELKVYPTTPKHANLYGLKSENPLYIQSIFISENQRLKGIGKKVLKYLNDFAIENGHDVMFGHITQKASFSKDDSRESNLDDVAMIKNWLQSNGYEICEGNNDFYKVVNNPDIRFELGGETSKNMNLSIYGVIADADSFSERLYEGLDYEKAMEKLSNAGIEEVSETRGGTIILEKKDNIYKFIGDLADYEDLEDYPIEDYYEDEDYFELIKEGDWETIEIKEIDPINKKSEETLHEIEKYYKGKYGNWKYNTINVNDKNGNYVGCIQLRIANHSQNIYNVRTKTSCKYSISVVIADKDYTKNKFKVLLKKQSEIEEYFDSSQKAIDIIKSIDILILDGINYLLNNEIYKRGGRTIAQTPAPLSERIYGSKKNVKGSAASKVNRITFTTQLTKSIKNKIDEHNEEYPENKVTLATAKAVVRRGMGAYSKSHRPTISGGMPNSRQAWGLARLNKFLMKKSGKPVKKAYIQDDDLL